jgi:hypothetical protein
VRERLKESSFLDRRPAKPINRIRGYRLGLYDPDPGGTGEITFVGPLHGTDRRERQVMAAAIRRFNELTADDEEFSLCLAAFPVEG